MFFQDSKIAYYKDMVEELEKRFKQYKKDMLDPESERYKEVLGHLEASNKRISSNGKIMVETIFKLESENKALEVQLHCEKEQVSALKDLVKTLKGEF